MSLVFHLYYDDVILHLINLEFLLPKKALYKYRLNMMCGFGKDDKIVESLY